MKFLKIAAVVLLLHMIYSFIASDKTLKDGMLCYIREKSGNDSIFTIFSAYGMRYSVESEVSNELVWRYRNKLLTDTMSIQTNQCKIFGNCIVDTLTPPRLISFCAQQYIFENGSIELVESEFCK